MSFTDVFGPPQHLISFATSNNLAINRNRRTEQKNDVIVLNNHI